MAHVLPSLTYKLISSEEPHIISSMNKQINPTSDALLKLNSYVFKKTVDIMTTDSNSAIIIILLNKMTNHSTSTTPRITNGHINTL